MGENHVFHRVSGMMQYIAGAHLPRHQMGAQQLEICAGKPRQKCIPVMTLGRR
jgi:hypothetical protein